MNYFNTLSVREQQRELGACRLLDRSEFNGVEALKGKKLVVVGCGAQGLHQGMNLRDSGLDVSYALRQSAIDEKRESWQRATENGFAVGTLEEMIPAADLVLNLTPDKQHGPVVTNLMTLMKQGACLSYSHGFNIIEEGQPIRDDITVIMVAPKSPGSEVRAEYVRGFGVPTLIAVHTPNDPEGKGLEWAKAYAAGTGGDRAGVLMSSFTAEVKSDLMGEQTILCGVLQVGAVCCYERLIEQGYDPADAAGLLQYGWETLSETMKHGGLSLVFERLHPAARVKAIEISRELKPQLRPLFEKHMDDILSGEFSSTMMADWANDDVNLLTWREATGKTAFENAPTSRQPAKDECFTRGVILAALLKVGVELAFECMTEAGMKPESAYYESLHEVPLIANTIARKRLYEMNRIISDTAEYGCYLFVEGSMPILKPYIAAVGKDVLGDGVADAWVSDEALIDANAAVREHPVEAVGAALRKYMNG